jgi:hypothetical protein
MYPIAEKYRFVHRAKTSFLSVKFSWVGFFPGCLENRLKAEEIDDLKVRKWEDVKVRRAKSKGHGA